MDGHARRLAHQPVDHRAVTQLEPARPFGLADDQLRGARVGQEGADTLDHAGRGDRRHRRAQLRRQRHGRRQSPMLRLTQRRRARRIDEQRGPGGAQGIGRALGGADQFVGAGQFADRDDQPLARRPLPADAQRPDMVEHLRIDRLGRSPQRQFAQRRQVGLGEEMRQRPRRFLRQIDLARLQPLDQFVRRNIDHLDLGGLQDTIGHRLAHADASETGDNVVQALDMLDIDRRVDVDPGIEQLTS